MGNLAQKLQEEQQFQQQQQPVQKPKKVSERKSLLSPGEKILGIAFAGAVFLASSQIVSNQASIYEMNAEIQKTEAGIQNQQQVNADLGIQVEELSRYDRIRKEAERQGLVPNENTKVVND
ncbi:cell division protein FtsL [Cytobacillus purgationiresistens]|uniref:Cell division protein FtsL n=1 Tax=Cytobacillus purgationiresistens TaxID=863449 RepID=A0ABU0ARJ3_9BACI|nr:cell division protein FtsL [Cytobacillus purgationiresistens]MDQ0273896.1 cell division protein FtsL [Cytobacillus purgationiresistens]